MRKSERLLTRDQDRARELARAVQERTGQEPVVYAAPTRDNLVGRVRIIVATDDRWVAVADPCAHGTSGEILDDSRKRQWSEWDPNRALGWLVAGKWEPFEDRECSWCLSPAAAGDHPRCIRLRRDQNDDELVAEICRTTGLDPVPRRVGDRSFLLDTFRGPVRVRLDASHAHVSLGGGRASAAHEDVADTITAMLSDGCDEFGIERFPVLAECVIQDEDWPMILSALHRRGGAEFLTWLVGACHERGLSPPRLTPLWNDPWEVWAWVEADDDAWKEIDGESFTTDLDRGAVSMDRFPRSKITFSPRLKILP